MPMGDAPSEDVDGALLASWGNLAGIDEVGRGALAGPLAVGVVIIDRRCGPAPKGITDSKALRPGRREALADPIRRWGASLGVVWATPGEICALGLTPALRLAALRGLALANTSLTRRGLPTAQGVLLDGKHDYLSGPASLFPSEVPDPWLGKRRPPVATLVKADLRSKAVGAASILAKVARDHYMRSIADPVYGWAANSGYGSAAHLAALRSLGISSRHRSGWNLPRRTERGEERPVD